MKARAVLMGGMGYPITESPFGMPTLKAKLEKMGFEVFLGSWDDRTPVYNFAHAWTGFLAYFGDSLGAGSAGEYPEDIARATDFVCGFQPSQYDARTRKNAEGVYVQDISHKIGHAIAIFDPWWIDTAGLGYARYEVPKGSKTKLLNIEHRGAHPDDWSYSQGVALAHMQTLLPK